MATTTKGRTLIIERTFDARRDLVWRAWTDPEHFKRWWGPAAFTAPTAKIDLRVGGKWLACMRSPEGQDFWSTGVYREVAAPGRLVFTDSFADPDGNIVPASYYDMGDDAGFQLEMLVTVTFEDRDGKTYMRLEHAGMPEGEHGDNAQAGWNESLDKLAASLA